MAKTTYYGIDPISDSVLALNDFSGTPNTEVLLFIPRTVFDQTLVSFVGCSTGISAYVDTRQVNLFMQIEIQTRNMSQIYAKYNEIYKALQGDQAVPKTSTRGTFNLVVAKDGGTSYGFIRCVRTGFDMNVRAFQTDDGVDFPLVQAPVLTVVTIMATTVYGEMQEIP